MVVQIMVSLFALVVVWRLWRNYRDRRMSLAASISWFMVWLAVVVFFWSPEIASRIALYTGITRGVDVIVYGAIIVIMYLLYRVFLRLEKFDRDLTALTRELALKHGTKKEHHTDPDR